MTIDSHHETWSLKSKAFRRWLAQRFYQSAGTAPGAQALQDAVGVLEGRALFGGPEHVVFTRVADYDGAVYLDLANDRWETVKITPLGWEVVGEPPVKFRRARGMAPLPAPVRGGRIDEFRPFVNVASESDWVLCVAWLVGALRPRGPYPILALHGEHDSAKSTTARLLRALIDPNTSPLRAAPREERDVMIAATNAWCLAFDNLSSLPSWLPDVFCRLSTGGGLATRELYTDAEEVLFEAQRPVILNGISEIATQSDLLDRMIMLELPAIDAEARRSEAELWAEFEPCRPRILGVLADAISAALLNFPGITLRPLPRMADFTLWTTAAEEAFGWARGTVLQAYTRSRETSNDLALEASLLTPAVRELVADQEWQGMAMELLPALNAL
ncbi:MAG: hypothetical protein ACREKH_15970, partial [Candidatus Rokuibacteriota bacterium]